MITLAPLLLLNMVLLTSTATHAIDDRGTASVIDGDGLMLNGTEHRLFGIDSVELDQGCRDVEQRIWMCGQAAKIFLKKLVDSHQVTCEWSSIDRYKRSLSICAADGVVLNAAIVSAGYAVAYTKYSTLYREQETDAKLNKRGIWNGFFLMPWDHRASGTKLEIKSPYADRKIKGNINRKGARLYHCTADASYKNTKITEAKGEQWFATPEEAEQSGWRRASNLSPCEF